MAEETDGTLGVLRIQKNNSKIVYSMDFDVTPHQLPHTYSGSFYT